MPHTHRTESAAVTKATSGTPVPMAAPVGRKRKVPAKGSTITDPTATDPIAAAPTITSNNDPGVVVPPPKKAATKSCKRATTDDQLAEPSNAADLNEIHTSLETQHPPKKHTKVNQPPSSRDPLPN